MSLIYWIVAASDHSLKIYLLPDLQFVSSVGDAHESRITGLQFVGEDWLITSSLDGYCKIWNINLQCVAFGRADPGVELHCCALDLQTGYAACGTAEKVIVWKFNPKAAPKFAANFNPAKMKRHAIYDIFMEVVTAMKFHPGSPAHLLAGSVDGLAQVICLNETDEDEAVVSAINIVDTVEKIGWFGGDGSPFSAYLTSSTGTVTVWCPQWEDEDTPDKEYRYSSLVEWCAGIKVPGDYVIDVVSGMGDQCFAVMGSFSGLLTVLALHEREHQHLWTSSSSSSSSTSSNDAIPLHLSHSGVVRCLGQVGSLAAPNFALLTAGEDSMILRWTIATHPTQNDARYLPSSSSVDRSHLPSRPANSKYAPY